MPTSSTTAGASAGSRETRSSEELLALDGLELRFGGVTALAGVDVLARRGELLAIIGPNGAGKSSLFNCINGVYHPQKGQVRFAGEDITGLPPHARASRGIARTFQNLALFNELSVLDNLMAARSHLMRRGAVSGMLWWGSTAREELAHREAVEKIIEFLDLEDARHSRVAQLPYGWRKRVEIGRALCMEPKLLLLDEPVAGMNQEETEDVARYLLDLKESRPHLTQILVEHNLGVVMDIADRVMVLDFGRIIADGKPEEVAQDPQVMAAYVGEQRSKQGGSLA